MSDEYCKHAVIHIDICQACRKDLTLEVAGGVRIKPDTRPELPMLTRPASRAELARRYPDRPVPDAELDAMARGAADGEEIF